MRGPLIQVIRSIRDDPWYGVSVVLILGLGIGISTSAYTVLDRLALRAPALVNQPDQIRRLVVTDLPSPDVPIQAQRASLSYPEYTSVIHGSNEVGEVTAYLDWPDEVPLRFNGETHQARVLGVATNYFAVFGIIPEFGRFFTAPSPLVGLTQGSSEVVLSDRYWSRAFGRRKDILGATVELYHRSLTVVGVAPAHFDGVGLDGPELWLSGEFALTELYGPQWAHDRHGAVWAVALRLRGKTGGLQERLQVALTSEAGAAGSTLRYGSVSLITLAESLTSGFARETRFATALWVVSLALLLVASINAGGLFLVRGLERQQQIAVALALGSARSRLVQRQVVEGMVLAFVGAVVGAILSRIGAELIRLEIGGIHYTSSPFDPHPLLYATLLAVTIGAITSGLPALRATRLELRSLLDDSRFSSGRDVRRLSALIHGVQIAFAVIGIYCASLFVLSGQRARGVELGMNIDNVIVALARVTEEGLKPTEARLFWNRVTSDLQETPGTESLALSSLAVIREYTPTRLITNDSPSVPLTGIPAAVSMVTARYNRVLRIHVLSGRDLTDADSITSEPVVLINHTGAMKLWPSSEALGRCVRMVSLPKQCLRIVGIVQDTKRMATTEPTSIQLFMPLAQAESMPPLPYLIVRVPLGAGRQVQERIRRLFVENAPAGTQIDIHWLRADWERATAGWVRSGRLLSDLGILVVVITLLGMYGSLTYDLLRRRRELGVRLALGARESQLLTATMRTALLWCSGGLVFGLFGAVWLALAVRALLFATNPWDLGSLITTLILVAFVGVVAAWLAARRAVVKDPAFLLRISR